MPIVRRRRVIRKRKPAMKKRMIRKRGGMMKRKEDYARCVEIQETAFNAVTDSTGENIGQLFNFCLQDFQRPQEVAHAFKYYRASKVELTFIPYFNVAATGGLNANRLTQLYYGVDRLSNRYIYPSETECLERGMTPKLFNKKCKLSFKPNLLQEISLVTGQPADGQGVPLGIQVAGFQNATALFNKWLPTQQSFGYAERGPQTQTTSQMAPIGINPYALKYHGAISVPSVEGQTASTSIPIGDVQLKVTWEFKGPRALKTATPLAEPNNQDQTSSQGPTSAIPNTQPTSYP